MFRGPGKWLIVVSALVSISLAAACSAPATAPPTAAPAKPAAAATTAPAPAATKAPEAAPTKAPEAAAKKIDYPTKPVTFSVHTAAGGSSDVGFRLLMAATEKHLGQPMPVVNKPGAGGMIHYTELARGKPDGYLIGGYYSPTTLAYMLDQERKVDWGMDDFTPIVNHVFDPNVIAVKTSSPHKTLADLVKAAKEQPGKITAAIGAKLGDDHLFMVDVKARTGATFKYVNFDGSAPARSAVMGDHVEVYVGNSGDVYTPYKDGEFRVLAIASDQRLDKFKDVPTLKELGFPILGGSSRGIAAPKGTPKEIVQVLEAALKKGVAEPDHIKKMDEMGLPIQFMGTAEYSKFMTDEYKKLQTLTVEAAKD